MRIIDKESKSGKLLYSLGIGIGIAVSLSNRRSSYKLTKELIKSIWGNNISNTDINNDIYRLRRHKLVKVERIGNEHKLTLTEDGQKILLRFDYEKMKINNKKVWDMKWRMILFDIPDKYRTARDSFRIKMKQMGCVRFNNSVWIYPYPCEKEINFIASYWKVERYVHFAIISKITNEEILRKHFNL